MLVKVVSNADECVHQSLDNHIPIIQPHPRKRHVSSELLGQGEGHGERNVEKAQQGQTSWVPVPDSMLWLRELGVRSVEVAWEGLLSFRSRMPLGLLNWREKTLRLSDASLVARASAAPSPENRYSVSRTQFPSKQKSQHIKGSQNLGTPILCC